MYGMRENGKGEVGGRVLNIKIGNSFQFLTQRKMKALWGSDCGKDAVEELQPDFDVFLVGEERRAHVLAVTTIFRVRGQIGEKMLHHALLVDCPKNQVMTIAVNET